MLFNLIINLILAFLHVNVSSTCHNAELVGALCLFSCNITVPSRGSCRLNLLVQGRKKSDRNQCGKEAQAEVVIIENITPVVCESK